MSDNTPPWAYEQPEVHPHDPRLIEQAEIERARLAELLEPWIVGRGRRARRLHLRARPRRQAGHRPDGAGARTSTPSSTRPAQKLQRRRLALRPARPRRGGPWRRFFVKPDPSGQHRYAHLHLIQAGHERWAQQLEFRDALRRDDELATTYANLKRRLAAEHPHDREAYTEAKAEFILEALRRNTRKTD